MDAGFGCRRSIGRWCVLALLVGVCELGVAARPAYAQRLPIKFGYGDTIDRLGQVADPKMASELKERFGRQPAVGYRYSSLTIGMPLWTWGGEYCVYARERYVTVSRAQAAELVGVPEQQLRAPFFYRFPFGLVVLPITVVIGVPGAYLLNRRRERERQRAEAHAASFIGADLPPTKSSRTFLTD